MIDLHSHVLPGIDDGADSVDESLELVRAVGADGTSTLAAAPHLREDHPAVRPAELAERCTELNRSLSSATRPFRRTPPEWPSSSVAGSSSR